MAEETNIRDTNTKIQLSLAAALFFSPLVQHMLKKNNLDLSENDKAFIRDYVKFWYITILFGLITITTGVLHYLFALDILNVVYTTSIFILIFLLTISMISILSDISLIRWGDYATQNYTVKWNKKNIILTYLPLYNIYLRYQLHNFEKPTRWIKESIFRWILFIIFCMFGNITISSIIILIITLRIASLISDIDVISMSTKHRLNSLFLKNPEELRGYITWFLIYIGKLFIHLFRPMKAYTLSQEVMYEKEVYSHILNIQNNTPIISEYIIWIFLLTGIIYFGNIDFTVRTYYTWFGLLITRYLIMAIQLKHLPHLPIAREIIWLFQRIWSFFKKESFIPKT